ncbi:hypothetical protein DK389_25770 [Methylobacterium durans]|uniref:DUF3551 domain-containing protein n=1 Tax=Methylobacterium durans TaxID=2202825 RepID=A0A2U8WAV9_9HYPH|nr:hypothetical protein DK389_25770 [Methylobacterium durans]
MILTRSTLIRTLTVAALGTVLVSQVARAGTDETAGQAGAECLQGCTARGLADNCYYVDQAQTGRSGKIVIRRVQECD